MITGKILKINGWPEGKVIGLAKAVAATLESDGLERDAVLTRLDAVRVEPGDFLADPMMGDLARELLRRQTVDVSRIDDKLHDEPMRFKPGAPKASTRARRSDEPRHASADFGRGSADAGRARRLRSAHRWSTRNEDAVIPYAVGVDIACRMRLSLYEVSPQVLGQHKAKFEKALLSQTKFGAGAKWSGRERSEHEVLDDAGGRRRGS
jgi:tRNA-splicing ligase RtcB